MKAATSRKTLFLAVALVAAAFAGCADVHRNPTSTVVSDASASQATDARSPTNVPF